MKKQKRRIISALCFLVLFIGYQVSITSFAHVHCVDGVILTHSHPFSGAHSHSKTSFTVIEHLSTFYTPEVDFYEIQHPMRPLLAVLQVKLATPTVKGEKVRMLSLRAPPALSISSIL